ncbi:dihydropteroate synthase [Candidatus Desulforudis audaxviator]|uniref:Dihydropteroate synthase n=1 Tax=Desulforudis audaxviator (strain MP104C) TaxID=477974 RepID=B1I1N2_DESAP|nr:dihydropteroate synthase [Candidatus Desulforudis audaxviator]ACA58663.1 dihydropteroate synthase [Candidatus Desulforudis audaxviator MP104C]AZK58663.1 Dihydropteroate synthase [Candidatus Desulforudis audaxviator]
MTHRVWVLEVNSLGEAKSAVAGVGADKTGCALMAPKAVHRVLRITGLTPVQANIIKQEMLACGGEAAVARGTINHSVAETDALLMGTSKQFGAFLKKLRMQPFGLAALADKIERVLDNYETKPRGLDCRGKSLPLGERTLVMGILNVTPDSFSDGGAYLDPEAALERAREMAGHGADLIDLGGESTRPGAEPVGVEEELSRVMAVLPRLTRELDIPVSVDTSKTPVARAALEAGAHLVNDQWALADEGMAELVARYRVPVVLMHNQRGTEYRDLVGDITAYFEERLEKAKRAGIAPGQIILDPGFGFGKTPVQNLTVLRRLREFTGLGFPLLIGTSRKSTIGKVLDLPVGERLEGTAATVAVGICRGADIVRVHDVREMVRVARMTDAIVRGGGDQ